MGCISSVPHEVGVEAINIEPDIVNEDADNTHSSLSHHNHNLHRMGTDSDIHRSLEQIESLRLENWTTNDLLCYISSIENGKFCDSKYDTFKIQLQALGIDGNTIHTLCYDPYYLKDLGLNNDDDIILIQTKCLQLYSNSEPVASSKHDKKEQNLDDSPSVEEDFFPLDWKFPLRETEHIKNHYYVGQKLFVQSTKDQAHIPGKCIYIENNWIVVRYKNMHKPLGNNEVSLSNDTNNSNSVIPPLNAKNVYKNMERIHVINESERISKTKVMKQREDEPENTEKEKHEQQIQMDHSDNDIFGADKEAYGMSFYSSGSTLGVVAIPNCYADPITYEVMTHPVTSLTSGRTYDKDMILEHIANYGTDPFSQQPMTKDDLFENIDLKRAIDRWLRNNPNTNVTAC